MLIETLSKPLVKVVLPSHELLRISQAIEIHYLLLLFSLGNIYGSFCWELGMNLIHPHLHPVVTLILSPFTTENLGSPETLYNLLSIPDSILGVLFVSELTSSLHPLFIL
jgi:hypothetical protein